MNRSNLRPAATYVLPTYAVPAPMPIAMVRAPAAATPEPLSRALSAFTPTSAWSSNLFATPGAPGTGQEVIATPLDTWSMLANGLGIAGTALGAYHGYKRTGSVGWALGWALLGGLFPIITIPVAYAQGFGKPDAEFKKGR